VALKILPPNLVDRSTVERFQREAQAMSRLSHPNLVKVFEVGMERGKHFFVMEFIEGDNLRTLVKQRKRFPEKETLSIIRQVAAALEYAHKEGVIHRDIKPANIMISSDGAVKLMDFGLVRIAGATRLTTEGSVVGTAEYMSPEQIDDKELDSRTDIYSLGITFYEMLAGHPPFQGETLQAVLAKQRNEPPVPISRVRTDVSPKVDYILKKAMAKELNQRYQKISELIADIDNIIGCIPGPVVQKPVSKVTQKQKPQQPQRQPTGRKPAISAAWGTTVIVLLITVGFFFIGKMAGPHLQQWMTRLPFMKKDSGQLVSETQDTLRRLEDAENHFAAARMLESQGQFDEAVHELREAIKLRRDHAIYYYRLALALEQKKDWKSAVKAWNDLLQYDADGKYTGEAQLRLRELEKNN
jgi:serine/threonine protein kinase